MLKFVKGVLIAELFALWVEYFYKFGVHYQPKGFFIAIPLYGLYLCILHGMFIFLREYRFLWLMGIVIGGMAGLMIEWFLVGNSPWSKPVIFQSGQVLFHGAYPVLGYLLVQVPPTHALRNRIVVYMAGATAMTSLGFFYSNPHPQKLWFLFLPMVTFVGLYYFIHQLASSQMTHPDPTFIQNKRWKKSNASVR